MNLIEFTELQRKALLDLVVLAMYADGHLAEAEDERVQRLLTAMGFTSEYDRASQYDAAVSRLARHSGTADAATRQVSALAQQFNTAEERRTIQEILRDIIASDDRVSPPESKFLTLVREALEPGSGTAKA